MLVIVGCAVCKQTMNYNGCFYFLIRGSPTEMLLAEQFFLSVLVWKHDWVVVR